MTKKKEIPGRLRTKSAQRKLNSLRSQAKSKGDLAVWRRCTAILRFITGKPITEIAEELDSVRSSVYNWLNWYIAMGTEGLFSEPPPGRPRRLSPKQEERLVEIIDRGPVAAGYCTGIWTGPMIADMIHKEMGIKYHKQHIPRLLHRLGFSVQRPRKRLARADAEAQEYWLHTKFPAIKKKLVDVVES